MGSHYELKPFREYSEQMENTARMQRIYTEGRKAGEIGLDTTACSYAPNSVAAKEWFSGFKEGKECR